MRNPVIALNLIDEIREAVLKVKRHGEPGTPVVPPQALIPGQMYVVWISTPLPA